MQTQLFGGQVVKWNILSRLSISTARKLEAGTWNDSPWQLYSTSVWDAKNANLVRLLQRIIKRPKFCQNCGFLLHHWAEAVNGDSHIAWHSLALLVDHQPGEPQSCRYPSQPPAASLQLWHGNGSPRTQRGKGSWQKNGRFTPCPDRLQSMGANAHLTARARVTLVFRRACFHSSGGHQHWVFDRAQCFGKENVARSLAVGQPAARTLEGRALSPKAMSLLIDRKNNFCLCRVCQVTIYGLGVYREVWRKSHQFWS